MAGGRRVCPRGRTSPPRPGPASPVSGLLAPPRSGGRTGPHAGLSPPASHGPGSGAEARPALAHAELTLREPVAFRFFVCFFTLSTKLANSFCLLDYWFLAQLISCETGQWFLVEESTYSPPWVGHMSLRVLTHGCRGQRWTPSLRWPQSCLPSVSHGACVSFS